MTLSPEPLSFAQLNEGLVGALLDRREAIRRQRVLERMDARLLSEGGHLLLLLPVHFVFDERVFGALAEASLAIVDVQTKILRHLEATLGREGILRRFRVPERMRRFVNWDELLDPQCLIARIDLLESPDGYRICELNVESCVACAEAFEFAGEYFEDLGVDTSDLGLTPPLTQLASLLAEAADRHDAARVVILDWSAGGGSAGKGYLSFERMRAHLAAAVAPIPVTIADERTFDPAWLTEEEARRTLIFRGFMMHEMDDGGVILERLLALGAPVVGTYETEIRMNKTWLALFHDEALSAVLDPGERALIRDYLPAACEVGEHDRAALIESKDRYIFKQKQSFGGQGIYLGESTSAGELEALFAGDAADDWIAQELCPTLPATFPADQRLESEAHQLVFGLYLYGRRVNGMLVRASSCTKVVNATSGGAKMAWAFIADDEARSALVSELGGHAVARR